MRKTKIKNYKSPILKKKRLNKEFYKKKREKF